MSLVVNATSTKLTPHWGGGPKLKKLKLGTKMLVFKIGGSKLPFYEKGTKSAFKPIYFLGSEINDVSSS